MFNWFKKLFGKNIENKEEKDLYVVNESFLGASMPISFSDFLKEREYEEKKKLLRQSIVGKS